MQETERSFSAVLQDIVQNVQEIVRSEVRLAKTEIRDEAAKAQTAGLLTAIGAVASMFAIALLLLAAVYALSLVMPPWAAALSVGIALAVVGGVTLGAAINRFRALHAAPRKTIKTVKDNIKWVKQQAK